MNIPTNLKEIDRIKIDTSDCEFAGLGDEITIFHERKHEEPSTLIATQTRMDMAGISAFAALSDGTYQVIELKENAN